jgi:hypothetical protein
MLVRCVRSTRTNPSGTPAIAGRASASIHVIPSRSPGAKPARPSRLTSSTSSSRANVSTAPSFKSSIASRALRQTSASETSTAPGTTIGSQPHARPQSVRTAAATGPSASTQKSWSTVSEGRAVRHHHWRSAASHTPASGSATRARCSSSVTRARYSSPDARTSRTDMRPIVRMRERTARGAPAIQPAGLRARLGATRGGSSGCFG